MTEQELGNLITFVQDKERVCPIPNKWNDLWNLLPDKQRVGNGWLPPLPLILAAGWETSDEAKRQRLIQHIQFAAEHDFFSETEEFLRNLNDEEWYYKDNQMGFK